MCRPVLLLIILQLIFSACAVSGEIRITEGVGVVNLLLDKNSGRGELPVYFYKPKHFGYESSVLIVIPGSGRNAADYRDSWIDSANEYNVLVIVPKYSPDDYDFAAYNLGGVITKLNYSNVKVKRHSGRIYSYVLDDHDISFEYVKDSRNYIFHDFDKIFSAFKSAIGFSQDTYDLFGHSAGGQLLHRYAIFKPDSLANRVVAANSGFYTLPAYKLEFPHGLKGINDTKVDLSSSFRLRLFIMVGENDNMNSKQGILLHTPNTDQQGLGRYERGQYFYSFSKTKAIESGFDFNWHLKIVEGVGHDKHEMGYAAAKLLYGEL
ncbi:hypothetical protein [Vibrio sp. HN007]|uniref:hypothetical protein n=1 Tax=Vibrio iocasae TaxID=3098914 RepID=UPI0035D5236E